MLAVEVTCAAMCFMGVALLIVAAIEDYWDDEE